MSNQIAVRETETGLVRHEQQGSIMVETSKSAAMSEVYGMISVAKRMPRDEVNAVGQITRACQRKSLAEVSQYRYARGGTSITGPSIDLMRVICNAWGNMDYGWQELERRDGESTVKAFAWDMQSNTRAQRVFVVRHWRDTKDGGYQVTDERDIYEMIANASSRRVRACLEELIPSDIVAAACQLCDKTMEKGGGEPLADQIRASLAAFQGIGVTKAQIEAKYQKKAEALTHYDISDLRKIFVAIKEGTAVPRDHFRENLEVAVERAAKAPTAAVESVKKAVGQSTKKKAVPAKKVEVEEEEAEEGEDDLPMEDPAPKQAAPQAEPSDESGEVGVESGPAQEQPQPDADSPQAKLTERVEALGADFVSFMVTMKRLSWNNVLKSLETATDFAGVSTENANRILKFWSDNLAKQIAQDAPPPGEGIS